MKLFGYDIGYQYDNEDKEVKLCAKYEDELVYSFRLVASSNTEAYSLYKDWSNYLYNMDEVFFLEEINQLKSI